MNPIKFYILIIRNNINYQIDDFKKVIDWFKLYTPFEIQMDFLDTNLTVTHKDFGVVVDGKSLMGLDGIKEQLRQTKKIPYGKYHVVGFLYEFRAFDAGVAAWTYPEDLQAAAFFEAPSNLLWEATNDTFRIFTHEILHCLHRIAWFKSIATHDTMDSYLNEMCTDLLSCPDGNRARNLKELAPYWKRIGELPIALWLDVIYRAALKLLAIIKGMNKIEKLAEAIKEYEGYFPGSRSQRNANPGNLKYANQKGSVGKDKDNFAIFPDFNTGWKALINQITIACNGMSRVYSPEDTLLTFFSKYAPKNDNNEPNSYCLFAAGKLGVDPKIKMKELLT